MADFDWTAFWQALSDFAREWRVLLTIIAIIVGAILARWIFLFVLRRTVQQVISGVKKSHNVEHTQELNSSPLRAVRVVQRTRTMGTVLNSVITSIVLCIAAAMILEQLGVSVLGILGAAGVIAAGLAFGAQSLVKDILNGMFMVFEDQLGVGDIVDLGEASGTVEKVGIRVTSIRSVDGTLWHVRNGEILRVGNMTQGWARVILDLPVPYHADIEEVKATILRTATILATSAEWRRKVLEAPEIWGVESLTAEALVVRLVMKARTPDQWAVARELRLRVKLALDELGVNVPSLNRMVVDDPARRRALAAEKAAGIAGEKAGERTTDDARAAAEHK